MTSVLCLAAQMGREQRLTRPNLIATEAARILRTECFACHNEEKKKGGLMLTSREALLKGNDDGPVVVPGKPDSSRLAKALLRNADPHMPPKKQLTDAQIKAIRDWIKGGLVWDAKAPSDEEPGVTPVRLEPLPASYQPVGALALSPDGKRLAIGRANSIVVHDASQTNFPILAQLGAHRDAVQALAWSSDGRWLASGAFRRLVLWDAESFKLEREWIQGLAGRVTALDFAPDGKTLALADGVTGQSGYVRMIDIAGRRIVASWRAHGDTIFDLEFSHDAKQLVTAGGDRLIRLWDTDSKKELVGLEGHTAQVLGVAFNTNATQVVSGGADKEIKVWDIKTREKIISLGSHSAAVTAVAWPGEGHVIVAATDGGDVFSYNNLKAHTGEQSSRGGDEKKIGDANEAILSLVTTPDAKVIFAGSHDGGVRVWNSERKLLAKLDPTTNEVIRVARPPITASRSSRRQEALTSVPKEPSLSEPIRASSRRPQIGSAVSLSAEPEQIFLSADALRHGVLITARTADGFEVDVTARAQFSATHSAPFDIERDGAVRAMRPGEGTLIASFGRRRIGIPVGIAPLPRPSPPVGERVTGGRVRGIAKGSWLQCASEF
ncbi:MAG TPA: c-type cytochrome domain-containing protein [Verrucomicrobiae bacterium]|nr:c-type cytochrome domain-containing protein [Verrucomicrobiae bacterium]